MPRTHQRIPEGSLTRADTVSEPHRVFYRPDAYGTGVDCATDTDLQPAELEDACVALSLEDERPG